MNNSHSILRTASALLTASACFGAPAGCATDDVASPDATSEPQASMGSAQGPFGETSPPLVLDAPRWFWRVDLTRTAAGTIAGGAAAVQTAIRPPPIADPEYFLLGLAGSTVVSAQAVSFPTSSLDVTLDEFGNWQHESQPVTDSSVTAFIEGDPSIDRVELVSADDTVLFSESVKLPPEAQAGVQRQQLSLSELATRYPHIRFLRAEDQRKLSPAFKATVVDPTDAMTDVLAESLAKLAPAMTAVTTTIAFVQFTDADAKSEVFGKAGGTTLILNADLMSHPKMARAAAHEIAHNFTFLSSAAATRDPELFNWPARARQAARETVAQFRLVAGVVATWADLHNSGVLAKVAGRYLDDEWRMHTTIESARAGGFATPYGSSNATEDFAEYVSTTQSPTQEEPGICPLFQGVSQIDPIIAIPFAKLTFLAAIGAITQQAYDTCVQGARIDYRDGIDFPGAVNFSSGAKVGYSKDGRTFGIVGNGPETYQLIVGLQLPTPKGNPLGLHVLEDVGFGPMNGRTGAFLANDRPLLVRACRQGFVLVTEASTEVTRGAFFGLVVRNPSGMVTDQWPFGTFQIR
jgi:hypothetical protein